MKKHILLTTVALLGVISLFASDFERKSSLQFRYLVGEDGKLKEVPSRFEERRKLIEERRTKKQVKSQMVNPNIRTKSANIVFAPPSNDNFADSIFIAGTSGTTVGSNVDATLESSEPKDGNSKTVWWSWTAPAAGNYKINTFGSDFDTFLAVFTGDSVDSLTLVAKNDDSGGPILQSHVNFCAVSGVTYRIQVSGFNGDPGAAGNITLSWELFGSFGGWILDCNVTSTYFSVWFAHDLSAFSYKKYDVVKMYFRTNEFGCTNWMYDDCYVYPDNFSITNKKNNKVLENKPIEGMSIDSRPVDYNGKQVLVYDEASKKLSVHEVKKGAFVKIGEQSIADFENAWLAGSEIYVQLLKVIPSNPGIINLVSGVKVFDKKLKKEKWNEPIGNGWVSVINKGLIACETWSGNNLSIIYKKKGKKVVAEHSLTQPSGYHLKYLTDKKAGVLYWTRETVTWITNSPLTYLDRKGRKVVDNESMTDVGNIWFPIGYDGKTFYVSKTNYPSSFMFYAYKLKGLKKIGEIGIDLVDSSSVGHLDSYVNKNVYVFLHYMDVVENWGAFILDRKLKKMEWSEDFAEGEIFKIGKDTLVRRTSISIIDFKTITTTVTYNLFNKKGEIVTYTFEYDE